MPPNKTQWHKELCKALAASPKLWMTTWIIHQEEEKKEGDNGKYEEEKLKIKQWTVNGIKGVKRTAL